jgi:hypothetical protein
MVESVGLAVLRFSASDRLHIPGCSAPHPQILKTASKFPSFGMHLSR